MSIKCFAIVTTQPLEQYAFSRLWFGFDIWILFPNYFFSFWSITEKYFYIIIGYYVAIFWKTLSVSMRSTYLLMPQIVLKNYLSEKKEARGDIILEIWRNFSKNWIFWDFFHFERTDCDTKRSQETYLWLFLCTHYLINLLVSKHFLLKKKTYKKLALQYLGENGLIHEKKPYLTYFL